MSEVLSIAPKTPPRFIHLRVHSEYSLVDGVIKIKSLAESVVKSGMPAVALTDQSNMFAAVRFFKAALANGVKPIVGVDLRLQTDEEHNPHVQGSLLTDRMVLLCQNDEGYKNLTRLVSKTYTHGQQKGIPVAERLWLAEYSQGLIALSGGREGDVGRLLLSGKQQEAEILARGWQQLFGDRYYIELERTGRENEEAYLQAALNLAAKLGIAVVATNDVCYLQPDDFDAHEARVCIHEGRTLADPRRVKRYSDQQYLRSVEEMQTLFADIPEALANTVEVAKRCNFMLQTGESFLPNFPIPEGDTTDSYFRRVSEEGLQIRLQALQADQGKWSAAKIQEYVDRLNVEIDVITTMGFPGYFLIVADFIRWAKENGVPVGPGRGSGAGSLVAYAMKITDLDPLEYDLLFERFLNPERVSLPDFDIDFCMDGRDRVIEYVANYYGREKVSQIITYGTMAAKAVVRDVGRVLGHPYGLVDGIAKLIPFELGMTLTKALEDSEDLQKRYDSEEEVTALLDLALKLEGCVRNAGKHAGGVVISPTDLTDFTPLYCEADGGSLVSQYDKDDVEAVGLVKFDFLGLRTLTIIDWAVKAVNKKRAAQKFIALDINRIPLDDEQTFRLLQQEKTTAIFQLESAGMKKLIGKLKPDRFEDIVALVALYRPGPLDAKMDQVFVDRKHGREEVEYAHPDLEPILEPTYGVILYQEQVMQIAQVLAGYSLGAADMLRRAMGKKKPEEMAKQREIFTEGALKNNVEKDTATYIFDLMEKFAGYGFNKSHSAAYALLSYQTAWLKKHYTAEFMAAVLSSDMDNTDKVVMLISECKAMGLTVLNPSVNHSDYQFKAISNHEIAYGLGAIKGLGEGAIETMVAERQANGEFEDLLGFCQRNDIHKLNKRALEALVKAGAMDVLGESEDEHKVRNRASLLVSLPEAVKYAEQEQRNTNTGQVDLFGEMFAEEDDSSGVALPVVNDWTKLERLANEKETLGLYLSGHPIDEYKAEMHIMLGDKTLADHVQRVEPAPNSSDGEKSFHKKEVEVTITGLVIDMRVRNSNHGKMGFLHIDDNTARVDVVIRPQDFESLQEFMVKDKVIVAEGSLGYDGFSGGYRLRAKDIYSLEQARSKYMRAVQITLTQDKVANGIIDKLKLALYPYCNGQQAVNIVVNNNDAMATLRLSADWRITPADQLLGQLKALCGDDNIALLYR